MISEEEETGTGFPVDNREEANSSIQSSDATEEADLSTEFLEATEQEKPLFIFEEEEKIKDNFAHDNAQEETDLSTESHKDEPKKSKKDISHEET